MLIEKRITKNFDDFNLFWQLYQTAFPEEERLPLAFLFGKNQESDLIACYDETTFCGFYSTVTFGDITHIMFFAIKEELRDRGYGSQVLHLIAERYSGNRIILDIEAEDPKAANNHQRIRRKAFYKRNGYTESEIAYIWRTVPYQILIQNGTITSSEFSAFCVRLEQMRKTLQ